MHELIARALAEFYSCQWALRPDVLAQLEQILLRAALQGGAVTAEARASLAQLAARRTETAESAGAVAVIPVHGFITPRTSALEELFGVDFGASLQKLSRRLQAAVADPAIGAIVLHFDTPGGQVNGVTEAAAEIHALRGQKKIVAVAATLCCSGGYWLASNTDEIVASPSAEVGNIGVFGVHQDLSKFYEQLGVKHTLISAGKYKTEGNPYEPLSEEAKAALQVSVDRTYDQFVGDVARGMGVKASEVRSGFGEGRAIGAKDALKAGMVHRVATLNETIARLASSPTAQRPRHRAAASVALKLAELG